MSSLPHSWRHCMLGPPCTNASNQTLSDRWVFRVLSTRCKQKRCAILLSNSIMIRSSKPDIDMLGYNLTFHHKWLGLQIHFSAKLNPIFGLVGWMTCTFPAADVTFWMFEKKTANWMLRLCFFPGYDKILNACLTFWVPEVIQTVIFCSEPLWASHTLCSIQVLSSYKFGQLHPSFYSNTPINCPLTSLAEVYGKLQSFSPMLPLQGERGRTNPLPIWSASEGF